MMKRPLLFLLYVFITVDVDAETCRLGCCWQGPGYYIVGWGGGYASGVTGPEYYDTVEACAKRCAILSDCKAFDYHSPGSYYGRRCYLWKAGEIYHLQSPGYQGYAGVCKEVECKCGLAKRSTRIVGGEETEVNEYPWQVGLVDAGSSDVWCGGSLISNRWILTAASCTVRKSASGIQALLGEHDLQDTTETTTVRMGISKIENHPDYNTEDIFLNHANYDFSLLKMEETISFFDNPHIRPICLPVDATREFLVSATVTGWGSTSNKLRDVTVKVLPPSWCYRGDDGYPFGSITDQMMCTINDPGENDCHRDPGGPLVTAGWRDFFNLVPGDGVTAGENYELIGVAWCGLDRGCICEDADYPAVYARVTKQLDWIYETTQQGWSTCPRE